MTTSLNTAVKTGNNFKTSIEVVLKGDTPSKKNSRTIVCRGRYPISLPSANYNAWHTKQMWELKNNRVKKYSPRVIEITFYPSNKRKADLTNKAESIMDLFVDAGILEDDNWFICPIVNLRFGGIDKENPRVIVDLH